jgi:hypothetical protein
VLLDAVSATFKALFHDVRAELLNCQKRHLSYHAFANSVNVIVRADIQNILNDVVSIRVLHELQRLVHDTTHQVGTSWTYWRVQTALDNAASVSVAGDITNTFSDSIEDEFCMLVTQLQKDPLNYMISVAINA